MTHSWCKQSKDSALIQEVWEGNCGITHSGIINNGENWQTWSDVACSLVAPWIIKQIKDMKVVSATFTFGSYSLSELSKRSQKRSVWVKEAIKSENSSRRQVSHCTSLQSRDNFMNVNTDASQHTQDQRGQIRFYQEKPKNVQKGFFGLMNRAWFSLTEDKTKGRRTNKQAAEVLH